MNSVVVEAAAKNAAKRAKDRINEEHRASDMRRKERAVAFYISNYFHGVEVPDGVDILSKRYVDMCVNSNICDAVDAAYGSLCAAGRLQSSCGDGTMGEDVRFVIKILKQIRQRCVPQEFSAGLLLMHLEILEGLSFSIAT